MNRGARVAETPPQYALASEIFDHFCAAGTMKQILALHREICKVLQLRPSRLPDFYPKIKEKLASSWKAQALFKKFDARANHKVYAKGHACAQNKVLIIGAGPCGLRAAIECQLLGAKVVVIEKRDRMSRNNVLHLWPFVIQDLRALGAKKFFGKFCAGSIDHISIRQLQCILLKVSLLLGVEIHEGVSFEELLEPSVSKASGTLGWRARVSPQSHPVSQYEFDSLLGADGKRNTLNGFKRKEFRGKLAMAITANFINRHSEQEASVPEISGVAFIFNQKFFKELNKETGIDLENIVYYKDDTHYFVMTAKKHSLINKGVILNDYNEISRLLSVENVDRAALMRYAQEAARFSTDGRLPLKDFALNHYGEPDVALFDFTSMYAAENASMVYERLGRRLLCQLVGDSLLEPFWPTGSGCARGFLSALDAAWAVRTWGQNPVLHPLDVIAERESIYRLLAQTTPENLNRDYGAYTLDPGTRYPNLNRTAVTPHRVTSFYDSDDPLPLDASATTRKRKKEYEVTDQGLIEWVGSQDGLRGAASPAALLEVLRRYRPDLVPEGSTPHSVYHILQQEMGIVPLSSSDSLHDVPDSKIRSYLMHVYHAFKGEVPYVHHESDVFDQIKLSMQKEKHARHLADIPISAYAIAVDADKSHSSYKRKRRALRATQVSTDPLEPIRKKIEKLDLNRTNELALLIEGHDAVAKDNTQQQKELQDQIISIINPDEAKDPEILRESLNKFLQGNTKTNLVKRRREELKYSHFFQNVIDKPGHTPKKLKGLDLNSNYKLNGTTNIKTSRRCLKGLDPNSIKLPKYKSESLANSDATLVRGNGEKSKTPPADIFELQKATPVEDRRRASDVSEQIIRLSVCPDVTIRLRSYSTSEATNTKCMVLKEITPIQPLSSESQSISSRSLSDETITQLQHMVDSFERKYQNSSKPDQRKLEPEPSIGISEMKLRKQRVMELLQSKKPSDSAAGSRRYSSGDMHSFRMQRLSEMIKEKNGEVKCPQSIEKRKSARDIMKQRFEKSLQMLASERPLDLSSERLENDYGLQQYRADAPLFDERVKKIERLLQHYEEGRIVSGGGKTAGRGAHVAKLAAELSGSNSNLNTPKPSKPKDLMRSVGKLEREDWNMKEIERKILENKLGRPEPRAAERVPKWDREQFLKRQKKLKEGDPSDEKWGEIDETLNKFDQKLRDSGRPDHGTKKVANLATKFVKDPEPAHVTPKKTEDEAKKGWRVSSTAVQCAVCGLRVFAAERVTADGIQLHRGCFRCTVCRAVLRPGNYTMERYSGRLVCLRHSGVSVTDAVPSTSIPQKTQTLMSTPERISIELSDSGAKEIDEDEWTDRNFLASETSCAGGHSDGEDSSSEEYIDAGSADGERNSPIPTGVAPPRNHHSNMYCSDDSFGYDDYSDDGAESSGNESCSRMREAREARRREVPADARPSSYSSEVESEEESESSDEVSSATEVSTDSEFAREESAPPPAPPSILVTEPPPPVPHAAPHPPPTIQDYPLSRTRSAGGLATKRALELKRKYLLGEPSPPAVRKSDSTSQIDTKFEAFRSNITEFQKMLNPAATSVQPQKQIVSFQFSSEEKKAQPMPDIIKNLCTEAPVDLLTKVNSTILTGYISEKSEPISEGKKSKSDLDSDSLSEDDSSHTETAPKNVPRLEVHDEGGELIQLDSLMIVNSCNNTEEHERVASRTGTATGTTVVAAESESSESGRDATTLALTETELSDWATEANVLDEGPYAETEEKKRSKNPRSLSGPKLIHDAKNVVAVASHVCGRTSPIEQHIGYSNALEHFEFADEGDQDPSIETPSTPKNEGYMELVDDEFEYSPGNDRSMNFIERSFSETVVKPASHELNSHVEIVHTIPKEIEEAYVDNDMQSPQGVDIESSEKSISENKNTDRNSDSKTDSKISDEKTDSKVQSNGIELSFESLSITEVSPQSKSQALFTKTTTESETLDDISPPLLRDTPTSKSNSILSSISLSFSGNGVVSMRLYSPAICRSASETFNRSTSRSTDSPTRSFELSHSVLLSSESVSSVSPVPKHETTTKVQELKREREEQTEVVRRLVLERLGGGGGRSDRRSTRRTRLPAASTVPPPVPPPPVLPEPPPPPPPPRPAPPMLCMSIMPVKPSFSDPELAREKGTRSIMKSISNYLNRRLGPRHKEPTSRAGHRAHESMGAIDEEAPPVPPRPAYTGTDENDALPFWCEARWARFVAQKRDREESIQEDPSARRVARHERKLKRSHSGGVQSGAADTDEKDALPFWCEARWARLVAQRRAREESIHEEPSARRVARLERKLKRPLSAEQQAATVAELVQLSAQRDAHQALRKADKNRNVNRTGD